MQTMQTMHNYAQPKQIDTARQLAYTNNKEINNEEEEKT